MPVAHLANLRDAIGSGPTPARLVARYFRYAMEGQYGEQGGGALDLVRSNSEIPGRPALPESLAEWRSAARTRPPPSLLSTPQLKASQRGATHSRVIAGRIVRDAASA